MAAASSLRRAEAACRLCSGGRGRQGVVALPQEWASKSQLCLLVGALVMPRLWLKGAEQAFLRVDAPFLPCLAAVAATGLPVLPRALLSLHGRLRGVEAALRAMATTAAGGGFALGDSAAVARAVNAEIDLRGEGFQTRLNSAAAEELEAAAKAGSVVARCVLEHRRVAPLLRDAEAILSASVAALPASARPGTSGQPFAARQGAHSDDCPSAAASAGESRGGRTDTRDHGQATGGGASRANEAIVELPGRAFACLDPFSSTGRVSARRPNLQAVPKGTWVFDPSAASSLRDCSSGVGASAEHDPARLLGPARSTGDGDPGSRLASGCWPPPRRLLVDIRACVRAPPGRVLLSLDFAQIELRVMAHLSADPGLVALFRSEADVFRTVAAQWLSRTASEVSDEERTQAKRLIYGVLYGMAPRRLAAEVGWSMDRARREVASIQRAFPGLVRFRASMERFCRAHSHVATIIGRRRWLPGIGDKSAAKRARARRQAFSTAVQGSAADIFRQALVRVTRVVEGINALHRAGALCAGAASAVRPSSGLRVRSGPLGGHPASAGPAEDAVRILLCVHDELLLEVAEPIADAVADQCRQAMTAAVPGGLSVPLRVSVAKGKAWSELA